MQIKNIEDLKILNRYDVEGISDKVFEEAKSTIFSEPQVDICYEEEYKTAKNEVMFGVEFLPGQFDQRANSLSECLQIIGGGERLATKSAKIYVLSGNLSEEEVEKIVNETIKEVNPTSTSDMGKIMGSLTPKLKGKADMSLVSKKVREKLSNL